MEGRRLAQRLTGVAPLVALALLVSAALFMMSAATQNSVYFEGFYSLLLIVSVIGIGLLLLLILLNLRHLVRQYRAGALGSRLTVRLLAIFVFITFVPVAVVYTFSLQLLTRGIDSWFDIKIERALNDALSLGRSVLTALQDDLAGKMREVAADFELRGGGGMDLLNELREHYGIADLSLFALDGQVLAFSSRQVVTDAKSLVPNRPNEAVFNRVRQGEIYANLDTGPHGPQLRVLVPVYRRGSGAPVSVIQGLQPLASRYAQLGESVQTAFTEYERLVYLRKPLKFGFTLTLTLVALLTLLVSVWAAMLLSRRLVAPVRNLAAGTRAVAQGDYRKRIPVVGNDEFGVLVKSFNDMTRKVQQAQNQIRRSQRETEAQRTYLETVLTHLSSGVLSFDARLQLRTHNASAAQILGADFKALEGNTLAAIGAAHVHTAPFMQAIADSMQSDAGEWQTELRLMGPNGSRVLIARGTVLPGLGNRAAGCVVVFDDVTQLIQAQRNAAWGEVARRLAHEIKNPLTPIQLSAERVRHKLLDALPGDQRETLDRATRTIIQQVDAMKSMVNEFTDYARPTPMTLEPVPLNALVRDVVELYRGGHERVDIVLELDESFAPMQAEPRRLRQVLHNLLLNAGDAVASQAQPRLLIKTACVREAKCSFVELQVRDNGGGFESQLLARAFEPYVTSKDKGTGLGLAIVKKIVEEHGGMVWAENMAHGACVTVRLPTRADARVATEVRA